MLLDSPRTLVIFGSYSIGKERVYLHVARELGISLYVDANKRRVRGVPGGACIVCGVCMPLLLPALQRCSTA